MTFDTRYNESFDFIAGIVFSTFVAVITTPTYHALFLFTLRKLPNSFTYGEASIVVQGCMVFLTNLFFKLISLADKTAECMKDESSTSCIMPTSSNYWTQNYAHQSETAQLTTILQVTDSAQNTNQNTSLVLKFDSNLTLISTQLDWLPWSDFLDRQLLFRSILPRHSILCSPRFNWNRCGAISN